MAFCEEYERLDSDEKKLFQAELLHALMFDKESFERSSWIVNDARKREVFKSVSFGNEIYNTGKPLSETDNKDY